MQNASSASLSRPGEASHPIQGKDEASLTLDQVVAALRRLAVAALDAGFPLPAAHIASTADRVEVEAIRALPPRPGYQGG